MSGNMRFVSKKRGSVVVLVVFAVVILSILGAGLLRISLNSRIFAIRTAEQIAARCAADAGISKALFVMNKQLTAKTWSSSATPWTTDEPLPNSDATFSFKVLPTGIAGKGEYDISSLGKSGQSHKTILVKTGLRGLFGDAIYVKEDLTLKSDTLITGYNSLDATDTDVDVKIGTISTADDQITLNNNVTVEGDVVIGVDGDVASVIKDLGGTTGNRYSMTEEPPFPDVIPPVLPDKGSISIVGSTLTLGPADSGRYSGISMKRSNTPAFLEISGGHVELHVTGNITLGQDCDMIIRPGSSVAIYLDQDITCGNNGGIDNQTGIPGNFRLYGTGVPYQDWDIKAKSTAFGAIYAPYADVVVYAKGDIGSSIVCNSFEFKAGGDFYYDKVLADVTESDVGARFVIEQWHEL